MTRIQWSLVAHTNVGKTTLARTLLRRGLGRVGRRANDGTSGVGGYAEQRSLGWRRCGGRSSLCVHTRNGGPQKLTPRVAKLPAIL